MPVIFQYGSNTSTERLNSVKRLNGAAKFIGTAYTKNKFDFDFTVWSKTNNCAAADILSEGKTQIWGILYDIPEELIYRGHSKTKKSLDAIEGEGKNYKRVNIELIDSTSKRSLTAITYVVKEKENGLKTSLDYASEIIHGLKSHNIPDSYLSYVYERILFNNRDLEGLLP